MLETLIRLARINSHSLNLSGLRALSREIENSLQVFEEKIQYIDLPEWETVDAQGNPIAQPLGRMICVRKRPEAPRQILLMIHMDTVYLPDVPSAEIRRDNGRLFGPGVADAKGGLVVMFKALEAFECAPVKNELGWTMLINPDEEIGSPGTRKVLPSLIREIQSAILFEPSFPGGELVGPRKGSGNFTVMGRGRAAHAGRNPHEGRNAIAALAQAVVKIHSLDGARPDLTVNVARIEGGSALNVVPDRAVMSMNIRIARKDDVDFVAGELEKIVREISAATEVEFDFRGGLSIPPKEMDDRTTAMYRQILQCGEDLGLSLKWVASGGVSDGNRLAELGIPAADSLGVTGGDIHSENEYCQIASLTERAKLTTLYLLKLASGKFD